MADLSPDRISDLNKLAHEFDSTGLGKLNALLVELAQAGLQSIKEGKSAENRTELLTPSEFAFQIKSSQRTMKKYMGIFGIEPHYGTGSEARYTWEQLELYKEQMRQRG